VHIYLGQLEKGSFQTDGVNANPGRSSWNSKHLMASSGACMHGGYYQVPSY